MRASAAAFVAAVEKAGSGAESEASGRGGTVWTEEEERDGERLTRGGGMVAGRGQRWQVRDKGYRQRVDYRYTPLILDFETEPKQESSHCAYWVVLD